MLISLLSYLTTCTNYLGYVASNRSVSMDDAIVLYLKYYPTICAVVLRKMTGNLTRTTQHTISNIIFRWLALLFHICDVKILNVGPGQSIVFLSSSTKVLTFEACLRISHHDFSLQHLMASPAINSILPHADEKASLNCTYEQSSGWIVC
jgi:hypothetical protein